MWRLSKHRAAALHQALTSSPASCVLFCFASFVARQLDVIFAFDAVAVCRVGRCLWCHLDLVSGDGAFLGGVARRAAGPVIVTGTASGLVGAAPRRRSLRGRLSAQVLPAVHTTASTVRPPIFSPSLFWPLPLPALPLLSGQALAAEHTTPFTGWPRPFCRRPGHALLTPPP